MESTRRVSTTDGLELHVRTSGPADGPVVVLVHGYPDTGAVWTDVAEHLASSGHHVVVPDVRGAGASDAPDGVAGYRLEQLAADLRRIVDDVVPDRDVHLVGHDWGSVQAWETVGTNALDGRLASYTSISGPGLDHLGLWMRSRPRSWSELRTRLSQAAKSWYVVAFHTPMARWAWRAGLGARFASVIERTEGFAPAAHHHADTVVADGVNGMNLYRANVRERTRRPRLRRAVVPVQLLVPTEDRFVSPAMADAVLTHCTTVERREFEAGHWGLLLGRSEQTAYCIADWVARVEAGEFAPGRRDADDPDGSTPECR